MKVLLISPHSTVVSYGILTPFAPVLPPLGLLSIGSVLRKEGHIVAFCDLMLSARPLQVLRQKLKDFIPDVVCLTATTVQFSAVEEIAASLKKWDSLLWVLLGGSHVSSCPEESLRRCKELDIGVLHEGESTVCELIRVLKEGGDLRQVEGIVFWSEAGCVLTPPRQLLMALDALPYPSYDLIDDTGRYSQSFFRCRGKTLHMVTSRGCVSHCVFCDQAVFGRTWRAFSAKHVVEEIRYLIGKHAVKFIAFEDDDFCTDRARAIDVCRRLAASGPKVRFGLSTKVTRLDGELVSWLRHAGCWSVYMGIESGSQRLLNELLKGTSLPQIRETVRLVHKHGLRCYGSFIIGLPTETAGETQATLAYSLSLPLDGISYFVYTPFPGRPLSAGQDEAVMWDTVGSHIPLQRAYHRTYSPRQLELIRLLAYLRFFLRIRTAIGIARLAIQAKFLESVQRAVGALRVVVQCVFATPPSPDELGPMSVRRQ